MAASREKRIAQIAAYVKASTEEDTPPSLLQISNALGLKKSPHTRRIVDDMVSWGILKESLGTAINGHPVILYSSTEHEYYAVLGSLVDQYRKAVYS